MHELSSTSSDLVTYRRRRGIVFGGAVRCLQANQMNGLRVYINGNTMETRGGCPVFYSRREDGPYYRWSYDDSLSEWQVGRVLTSGVSPKVLAPATWKTVPAGLQRSMVEHYED